MRKYLQGSEFFVIPAALLLCGGAPSVYIVNNVQSATLAVILSVLSLPIGVGIALIVIGLYIRMIDADCR